MFGCILASEIPTLFSIFPFPLTGPCQVTCAVITGPVSEPTPGLTSVAWSSGLCPPPQSTVHTKLFTQRLAIIYSWNLMAVLFSIHPSCLLCLIGCYWLPASWLLPSLQLHDCDASIFLTSPSLTSSLPSQPSPKFPSTSFLQSYYMFSLEVVIYLISSNYYSKEFRPPSDFFFIFSHFWPMILLNQFLIPHSPIHSCCPSLVPTFLTPLCSPVPRGSCDF